MRGYDFDRQRPIDNYIVDFYCKELQLAIEIDGESHHGNDERDKKKDERLNQLGVTVLRFDDPEIMYKMDKVLAIIGNWIDEQKKPTPNPSREGSN